MNDDALDTESRKVHAALCGETPMWLFERTDSVGYDEYDSCIVVAPDEKTALKYALTLMGFEESVSQGRLIGYTATEPLGIIHSSFNAG